jgi:hypothetical protein
MRKRLVDTGGKLCGSMRLYLNDKNLGYQYCFIAIYMCIMADKDQTLGQLPFSNMFILKSRAFLRGAFISEQI